MSISYYYLRSPIESILILEDKFLLYGHNMFIGCLYYNQNTKLDIVKLLKSEHLACIKYGDTFDKEVHGQFITDGFEIVEII